MDSELKEMLSAIREGQQVFQVTLEGFMRETRSQLQALAADVAEVKDQIGDVRARMRHLTHKAADLEEEISVLQTKQKP